MRNSRTADIIICDDFAVPDKEKLKKYTSAPEDNPAQMSSVVIKWFEDMMTRTTDEVRPDHTVEATEPT